VITGRDNAGVTKTEPGAPDEAGITEGPYSDILELRN